MSVRSRIEVFEALSRPEGKDDSGKEKKNEATTEKRKRFLYPGNSRKRQEPEQPTIVGLGPSRSKTSNRAEFEADLQEVWSVRKNIHHTGKPLQTTQPSVSVTAVKYSRHGAIPAQQSQGPQTLNSKETLNKGLTKKDDFSFSTRRSPLQEHNSVETPWNVRASTFSYSEVAKRPIGSPQVNDVPPTAKRKTNIGGIDVIRPTNDQRISPVKRSDKAGYAKRMAQGYLRSVGIGAYTPKRTSYIKESDGKATRWKKVDDDFDFDV